MTFFKPNQVVLLLKPNQTATGIKYFSTSHNLHMTVKVFTEMSDLVFSVSTKALLQSADLSSSVFIVLMSVSCSKELPVFLSRPGHVAGYFLTYLIVNCLPSFFFSVCRLIYCSGDRMHVSIDRHNVNI